MFSTPRTQPSKKGFRLTLYVQSLRIHSNLQQYYPVVTWLSMKENFPDLICAKCTKNTSTLTGLGLAEYIICWSFNVRYISKHLSCEYTMMSEPWGQCGIKRTRKQSAILPSIFPFWRVKSARPLDSPDCQLIAVVWSVAGSRGSTQKSGRLITWGRSVKKHSDGFMQHYWSS